MSNKKGGRYEKKDGLASNKYPAYAPGNIFWKERGEKSHGKKRGNMV